MSSQKLQDVVVFTVRLPKELHREFKAKCAKLGLEMSDVARAMLELFLDDPEFRRKVLKRLGIEANELGLEDPVPL